MTTRTFLRAPAFDTIDDILAWSERHGVEAPKVEQGIDGTFRGSVEVKAEDADFTLLDYQATEMP